MSPLPSGRDSVSGETKRARVMVSSTWVPSRSKTIVTCEPSGPRTRSATSEVVTKLTTSEVADRVRGPEGSQVTIVFDRDGTQVELTITRARFVSPLTESRPEGSGDIAYVRIKQLISSVTDDAVQALRKLQ